MSTYIWEDLAKCGKWMEVDLPIWLSKLWIVPRTFGSGNHRFFLVGMGGLDHQWSSSSGLYHLTHSRHSHFSSIKFSNCPGSPVFPSCFFPSWWPPCQAEAHFQLLMTSQRKCGSQQAAVLLQEYLKGKEYIVDHVSRDGVHKTTLVWALWLLERWWEWNSGAEKEW